MPHKKLSPKEQEKEDKKLEMVNTELARRQELIKLGLREPSKLEQARAEILGVTPEQRAAEEQKSEAAKEEKVSEEISQQPVETAREIPIGEQPVISPFEKVPVFRDIFKPEATAQAAEAKRTINRLREGGFTNEEIQRMSSDPNIAALGLNELDLEVIRKGEASVSNFGEFIETTPIIPRKIKAWVAGVTAPSEKVNELKKNVGKASENIILWSDSAKNNPRFASRYIKLIEAEEQNILRLESRIKLISLQSPDLQANPEQINLNMAEITNVKTTIQNKRNELSLLGLR